MNEGCATIRGFAMEPSLSVFRQALIALVATPEVAYVAALRTTMLNRMYHRQLSVYPRLLDASLPVVYGPTAYVNPCA